jgi:hypothetical protein
MTKFINSLKWDNVEIRNRILEMAKTNSGELRTIYAGSKGMAAVFQRVVVKWLESLDTEDR